MSDPAFGYVLESPVPSLRHKRRRYLKLIILCTIPVLLLAGLLWRQILHAREASHWSMCKGNLKQFGVALLSYHDMYGSFPPAFVVGPDGRPWHSWRILILPYLDGPELYEEYRFDEPWDGPNNRKLLSKMPEVFACPSRPRHVEANLLASLSFGLLARDAHPVSVRDGNTSYAAVLGKDCAFRGVEPVTLAEITDGTSSTAFISESCRTRIPWTKPEDIDIAFHSKLNDPDGFSSYHDRGCHFLFGDGTVRFVKNDIEQRVLDGIFTRNGAETICNDF